MFALVTGATGFLGSHLVERLRGLGHRVRALARDRNKARMFAGGEVEVFAGDLTSPESLTAAVAGVDVIFHAAALVSDWSYWSEFLRTTVGGTESLLEAAARASVQRFVHISTVRVYDDRHARKLGVVTEETPHGPRGFRHFGNYARAKVMAEAAVMRYRERLPISIIRPSWIYGTRDETIMPSMIRWLRDPLARWPGTNDPCADPIYVTDVADCAIAAALSPTAIGQAYNASPHSRVGVRQFLGAICKGLDIQIPEKSVPYSVGVFFAYFWETWAKLTFSRTAPRVTHAGLAILSEDVRHDPTKAERDLGWRSQVELEDGVARTAAWLRERHAEILPAAR